MSVKGNKLISQESMGGYGKEAAEGTKVLSHGDDKFDRVYDKFEEARAE